MQHVYCLHVCALLCLLHELWRYGLRHSALLNLFLLRLDTLQKLVGKREVAELQQLLHADGGLAGKLEDVDGLLNDVAEQEAVAERHGLDRQGR